MFVNVIIWAVTHDFCWALVVPRSTHLSASESLKSAFMTILCLYYTSSEHNVLI